jgi:hypothetical protein
MFKLPQIFYLNLEKRIMNRIHYSEILKCGGFIQYMAVGIIGQDRTSDLLKTCLKRFGYVKQMCS